MLPFVVFFIIINSPMDIVRFSAVEVFGIPIDKPETLGSTQRMVKLLGAYSVQPLEITTDVLDITPYYWDNPTFRYFLSRNKEGNSAVVDLMPCRDNSSASIITPLSRNLLLEIDTPLRSVEIPTLQETVAILGPSPRFGGQICLHELVAAL
jgi:hypothetical protein